MRGNDGRSMRPACPASASALQAAAAIFGSAIVNNDVRLGKRTLWQADRNEQKIRDKT